MPKPSLPLAAVLLGVTLLGAPLHVAAAQLPIPSLSIMGGVSHYDLSGTGTAPFGAVRIDIPLLTLIGEGSLGVFRSSESDGHHTYIIPEAQLQWQLLPFLVKPYIGVGGGVFRAVSGPNRSEFTASASAGVRVAVPLIGAGLRGEVRVRGIGTNFGSSAEELTLGLSW
jgi:hypothetical protein